MTWDNGLVHPDDVRRWTKSQSARRNQLAHESLDIEIWGTRDIHNTATRLRAQAYDEKLKKRKEAPFSHSQQMAKLLADKLPHIYGDPGGAGAGPSTPGPSLRPRRQATDRSSVQSAASGSLASSSRSSATLSSTSRPTPSTSATSVSVSATASTLSSSKRKGKGKEKAAMSPALLRTPSPVESTISFRSTKPLPSRARKGPPPKMSR